MGLLPWGFRRRAPTVLERTVDAIEPSCFCWLTRANGAGHLSLLPTLFCLQRMRPCAISDMWCSEVFLKLNCVCKVKYSFWFTHDRIRRQCYGLISTRRRFDLSMLLKSLAWPKISDNIPSSAPKRLIMSTSLLRPRTSTFSVVFSHGTCARKYTNIHIRTHIYTHIHGLFGWAYLASAAKARSNSSNTSASWSACDYCCRSFPWTHIFQTFLVPIPPFCHFWRAPSIFLSAHHMLGWSQRGNTLTRTFWYSCFLTSGFPCIAWSYYLYSLHLAISNKLHISSKSIW